MCEAPNRLFDSGERPFELITIWRGFASSQSGNVHEIYGAAIRSVFASVLKFRLIDRMPAGHVNVVNVRWCKVDGW